jgi:hypothetical protein
MSDVPVLVQLEETGDGRAEAILEISAFKILQLTSSDRSDWRYFPAKAMDFNAFR